MNCYFTDHKTRTLYRNIPTAYIARENKFFNNIVTKRNYSVTFILSETKADFRCECEIGADETIINNHICSNIVLAHSLLRFRR